MSMYRFCGAFTEVGEVQLKKFGQSIAFSDEMAADVILGGGCIVPAADFDMIAFTEQELSLYSDPLSHEQANAAFHAKKKRAQLVCHEIRERLRAGEPLKPVLAPPAPTAPAVSAQ
jgi:hypothetical protein